MSGSAAVGLVESHPLSAALSTSHTHTRRVLMPAIPVSTTLSYPSCPPSHSYARHSRRRRTLMPVIPMPASIPVIPAQAGIQGNTVKMRPNRALTPKPGFMDPLPLSHAEPREAFILKKGAQTAYEKSLKDEKNVFLTAFGMTRGDGWIPHYARNDRRKNNPASGVIKGSVIERETLKGAVIHPAHFQGAHPERP